MVAEFRFECKFCNKSIYAPYDAGGKRIPCPHCKQPVTIPIQDLPEGYEPKPARKPTAAIPMQQNKGQGQKQTQVVKKQEQRAIQVRYKWAWLKSLVKFAILIAIVIAAWKGYEYYEKQQKKDLATLIREYGDGTVSNQVLIKNRITLEDLETIHNFSDESEDSIRELMAECMGDLKSVKSYDYLARLLKDKKNNVRQAAAKALGNIRLKKTVELLIKHLDTEKDEQVRSNIGFSLRSLTGQNPPTGKQDFWQLWWKNEGHKFQIKPQ